MIASARYTLSTFPGLTSPLSIDRPRTERLSFLLQLLAFLAHLDDVV